MIQEQTVGIPYTVDTGEKLMNETFGPNNIRRRKTGTHELKPMGVKNGRLLAERLSLEEQGFVFVEHKTKVADFFDAAQLESVYYSEVEQLIKSVSGATRVVIFDHTLRSGDEGEREQRLIREPVLSAHNDYTEWSGPNRVREALPDEAEALLAHRFAIIQVWRAINQPIQANPLALADAKSVDIDDLIVAERRYPHRVGQTYRLKYNPKHRWFYFPEMRRWYSRFSTRRKTAAPVLRRTHLLTIRRLRQMPRRARASKCGLSRFLCPDLEAARPSGMHPLVRVSMASRYPTVIILLLLLSPALHRADAGPTKLIVAYSSPAATFTPGWIAKREGLFAKYNLDVEMVLMQGPSTYMPALASGNIHVLYGGGTAVSRAIGTGGFDLIVVATETRYIPMRLMVNATIRNPMELKGKKLGVGRAGLDEYAALLYLDKVGLALGKDIRLVYMAGGIPNRATAMKQGLVDGVIVNPPNEYDLEKAGYHELANFLDFKMPYAGVPQTVARIFRDRNRRIIEDYMTAIVEGMQIFRTNREIAYKAIMESTRQKDSVILERTYDSYAKQYDAIGGRPFPWQAGIEGMITGFHERFNPQGIKNHDATPYLDPSFVQKAAERLKLDKR